MSAVDRQRLIVGAAATALPPQQLQLDNVFLHDCVPVAVTASRCFSDVFEQDLSPVMRGTRSGIRRSTFSRVDGVNRLLRQAVFSVLWQSLHGFEEDFRIQTLDAARVRVTLISERQATETEKTVAIGYHQSIDQLARTVRRIVD